MHRGNRALAPALVVIALAAAAHAAVIAAPQDEPNRLRPGIDLAADYLVRNCDAAGRFRYRAALNAGATAERDYNILRHAGSIYALGMYEAHRPDERTRSAMVRAARFLKAVAVRPVDGHPGLLAVWSDSDDPVRDTARPRVAKLGGTGLGLVALLGVERVHPGQTPLEDLRSLGRFALFMQKPDGSFYSKYRPDAGGRDDGWTSLYYPGETALGLVLLHEKDGSTAWLRGAAAALAHLARSRERQTELPADHWALLATARLLPLWDRTGQPLASRDLVAHAARICEGILAQAGPRSDRGLARGSLTGEDRTCPTATRAEGLLAALTFLPLDEYADLRARILPAVREAIDFLLRAQVTTGEHAGGIPGRILPLAGGAPRPFELARARSAEVRIDYVQHALSAMLDYLARTEGRTR